MFLFFIKRSLKNQNSNNNTPKITKQSAFRVKLLLSLRALGHDRRARMSPRGPQLAAGSRLVCVEILMYSEGVRPAKRLKAAMKAERDLNPTVLAMP